MASQTRVKRSAIHGRGLFAQAPFKKGDFIGEYEGPPAKRNSPYVLWFLDDDGTEQGIVGRNTLRFVNHSQRPNAEFQGPELYATTPIQPGDEITVHYGEDWSEL